MVEKENVFICWAFKGLIWTSFHFFFQCDLSPWAVTKEEIDQFSKENGFTGWTETSVKENKNVTESMRYESWDFQEAPQELSGFVE